MGFQVVLRWMFTYPVSWLYNRIFAFCRVETFYLLDHTATGSRTGVM